jgi:hypothetical protein
MTKLDPTLKHLGLVLHRQMADVPAAEMPPQFAALLARLARSHPNSHSNMARGPVRGAK